MFEYGFTKTKVCPVCKKEFHISVSEREWAYHKCGYVDYPCVCSRSCVRRSESEHEQIKKEAKARKLSDRVSPLIMELYDYMQYEGLTRYEVAEALGVKYQTLCVWMVGAFQPGVESKKRINKYLDEKWRCIK